MKIYNLRIFGLTLSTAGFIARSSNTETECIQWCISSSIILYIEVAFMTKKKQQEIVEIFARIFFFFLMIRFSFSQFFNAMRSFQTQDDLSFIPLYSNLKISIFIQSKARKKIQNNKTLNQKSTIHLIFISKKYCKTTKNKRFNINCSLLAFKDTDLMKDFFYEYT